MSESILESIDHQLQMSERASHWSRPTPLQKWLAGLFGFLLMGATVAPIAQNWQPHPKDDFPFSYYPMFSMKRGKTYTVSYVVGLDGQGNRHLIPHTFAGIGGLNQTRRQIIKLIREGKPYALCQAVASRVAGEDALPYSEIVTIDIVTGRFRFADYFGGNKTPQTERVRASCQVARGEGEPATEDEP